MTWHEDIDVVVSTSSGPWSTSRAGSDAASELCSRTSTMRGPTSSPAVWERYVDEQQQLMLAGRRPYAVSTVVDEEAAARVADEAGVADADTVRLLAASAQRLEPWPDSTLRPGSDRLAPCRGRAVERQSLGAHQDQRTLPGCAGTKRSRPRMPTATSPIPTSTGSRSPTQDARPSVCSMVAAHAWDLRAAQAAGMRTAYVERPVGDPPRTEDSFDLVATGLDDLATTLTAT